MKASIVLAVLTSLAVAADVKGRWFDRIVVLMLGNSDVPDTISLPSFQVLLSRGVFLSNYQVLEQKASQPNFIATIYGDTMVDDDEVVSFSGDNLIDRLEAANISWSGYFENYPGGCFDGEESVDGQYERARNPFISMENIRLNETRCAKIVKSQVIDEQIKSSQLPQVMYYVPNDWRGGFEAKSGFEWWIAPFLSNIIISAGPESRTLAVVTFDRCANTKWCKDNKQVLSVLYASPGTIPDRFVGMADGKQYTHNSLLRTILDNWELPLVGRKESLAAHFDIWNDTAIPLPWNNTAPPTTTDTRSNTQPTPTWSWPVVPTTTGAPIEYPDNSSSSSTVGLRLLVLLTCLLVSIQLI